MKARDEASDDLLATANAGRGSPLHGFQGDRAVRPEYQGPPFGVTVAVSREAGARGGTVARRTAEKLGWQVYHQELLEYISQEASFRGDLLDNLSPAAARWAEERLEVLLHAQNLSQHPSILNLARVVLALGAQGEAVIIGRGAGCILPAASTLHIRIMAPLDDRIAYMSDWLRLTTGEAADQVHRRDSRRAEFISTHFHRQPSDIYQYDLLLNSSLLGGDLCAELIAQAARSKAATRSHSPSR
jgi:cytidylate kinase